MKQLVLIALVVASLALLGCAQQNPEEKAIALADNSPEIKLITRIVDSTGSIGQCTVDKFISGYSAFAETQGQELPPITESQRSMIREIIDDAAEWGTRCSLRLTKAAEKESENIYIVKYRPETSGGSECAIAGMSDISVSVDIVKGTAEPVGAPPGFQSQMEALADDLGDCLGVMLFSAGAAGQPSTGTVTRPGVVQSG